LQKLWSEEEITLIISLFTKLESKKNDFEKRGYLDAITNIINGKDDQVATTLEKLITSL
jgi:predicted ABC-type exoprotein transport system permease subunit